MWNSPDSRIETRPSLPRTACYAPHMRLELVERPIGTTMGAVHLLPGTTQSSVVAKCSHEAEAMAAMTLREFDRRFALEI